MTIPRKLRTHVQLCGTAIIRPWRGFSAHSNLSFHLTNFGLLFFGNLLLSLHPFLLTFAWFVCFFTPKLNCNRNYRLERTLFLCLPADNFLQRWIDPSTPVLPLSPPDPSDVQ